MTPTDRPTDSAWWLTLGAAGAGWTLLCGSILAIGSTSTITQYEPDLYTVLPAGSILALIAAVGCFCVAIGADRSRSIGRIGVVSGLTGIVLVAATVFYAPWLRGYEYFSRGDLASHLGTILTIAESGSVSQQDFYPAARLVGGILEMATGLGPAATFLIGRIAMTLVFMAGSVALARIVLGTKRWDVLVAAAAAIPIAGSYAPSFLPAAFAVALSPALIVSLVLMDRSQPGRLVGVVLTICVAISHPLIAMIDIVILALWIALSDIAERRGQSTDAAAPRFTSAGLIAVAFLAWITPFAVFRNQLVQVRDAVTGEGTGSTLTRMLDLAGRAGFGIIDSARLAIETNIGVIIVLAIAFPAAVSVLARRRSWPGSRTAVATIVMLLVTLAGLTLVAAVGLSQLDLFRFVQIAGIVLPVCVGIAAAVLSAARPRLALAGLVGLFAVSFPFVHPSPNLFMPSDHVPPNEVAGVLWVAQASLSGDVPVGYLASAKFVIPYGAPAAEDPLRVPILSAIRMPDHLVTSTAGSEFGGRFLVPVSDMERYAFESLWASAGRFTSSDFNELDADPRVSKPYAGSRIDVYLVGVVP